MHFFGRELHIRAWDKKYKKMFKVQGLEFTNWWLQCCDEKDNICYGPLESTKYGERNSFKNEETDRHILMRYIGREDVNGIKLYEGDIVEIVDDSYLKSNIGFRGYIDFKDCSFVITDESLTCYRWMDIKVKKIGDVFTNVDILARITR